MSLLRDKTFMVCLTIIVLAFFGGMVALILTNHNSDAFKVIGILTGPVGTLAAYVGITNTNRKTATITQKKVDAVSHDATAVALLNHGELAKLTNGHLKQSVIAAVEEVLNNRSRG